MIKTYRRIAFSICLTALLAVGFVACKSSSLAPGGAYAPYQTNGIGSNVTVTVNADMALYDSDLAFQTAYKTLDTLFQFELNNRQFLWNLSPSIKHTLDRIRPEAWTAVQEYTAARTAYIANPTPSGLTGVNQVVAKVQQLLIAATAAIGTQTTAGTNSIPITN